MRKTPMRVASLAAVVATLAAGCGGDDEKTNADRFEGDEADVAAIVDDFAEAGREGDGDRVCGEIFSEELANFVQRAAKQDCAAEVEENLPEDEYELTVDSVKVKGTAATVSVTDQDDNRSVLHMQKDGDDWRVIRLTPGVSS